MVYFRDPYYVQELLAPELKKDEKKKDAWAAPAAITPALTEEKKEEIMKLFGPENNTRSREKLLKLKEDVTSSQMMGVKGAYLRPTHLAEVLFEDLKNYVEKKFPTGVQLTDLQRERLRHQMCSKALRKVYLPNEEYFNRLDKHVNNTEVTFPLVVKGSVSAKHNLLLFFFFFFFFSFLDASLLDPPLLSLFFFFFFSFVRAASESLPSWPPGRRGTTSTTRRISLSFTTLAARAPQSQPMRR